MHISIVNFEILNHPRNFRALMNVKLGALTENEVVSRKKFLQIALGNSIIFQEKLMVAYSQKGLSEYSLNPIFLQFSSKFPSRACD